MSFDLCGCSANTARVWYNWTGKPTIGCPVHPPPNPEKPAELVKLEEFGQELAKKPWTGEQADAFLKEHPNHSKITGSLAIATIWKDGGKLVAYYIRSFDSFGTKKDGWIYQKT
jgi:hypothetical protein